MMDNFTIASFLHLFMRVALIGGLVAFGFAVGERLLDYKIKKAVKAFVDAANLYIATEGEHGTVWPLLLFTLGVPGLIVYLLG